MCTLSVVIEIVTKLGRGGGRTCKIDINLIKKIIVILQVHPQVSVRLSNAVYSFLSFCQVRSKLQQKKKSETELTVGVLKKKNQKHTTLKG